MTALAAPTGPTFEDTVTHPERAACRGRGRLMDPGPDWRTRTSIETARSVCYGCPVLDGCRAWVLALDDTADPGGICAALTEAERARRRDADQPPEGYKRCGRCTTVRPVAEFYRDCRARDGRQTTCAPCQLAHTTDRYHAKKGH